MPAPRYWRPSRSPSTARSRPWSAGVPWWKVPGPVVLLVYRLTGRCPPRSGRQQFARPAVALPVSAPVPADAGAQALGQQVADDLAVGPTAGVLPIGHLMGIAVEILRRHLVDLADLETAKAAEVTLRLVVRGAIGGAVFLGMIDAPEAVLGVQQIVGVGFVGG